MMKKPSIRGNLGKPRGARRKKMLTLGICALVAVGITVGAFLIFGPKQAESSLVSAGLQQLADGAYLACSAPVGTDISFTPEWFDQTLQGSPVTAITVTKLPPVTEGVLKLGHGEVAKGQTIPRETLSYLCFTPRDGVRESSFEFVPVTKDGTAGYSLSCVLSLTDSVNCCPSGTRSVTAVSTHSTLALTGTLFAEDPEGGKLCFEIVSYPKNGTLTLNSASGAFSYLPTGDFAGSDSFTWRAQDAHGAFSETATVEITVREMTAGYLFTDIADSNTQSAALLVSEMKLMSGESVGGKHYFKPHEGLTRAAFVVILLEAAGIEAPETNDTGFKDDSDIPAGMKGAIRYAREKGWLGDDERFRPNEPITRAEAARIAAAVLELSAPGFYDTVEDFSTIPVDVVDAMYAIYEGGYITTMADGTLSPAGVLTRGDAARFFSRVLHTH